MTRPMVDMRGPEYQAVMQARQMHRKYGADYKEMMWAEETLARLEQKMAAGDYSEQDRADFRKAKEIYAYVHAKSGDKPAQPRVSAGHSDGLPPEELEIDPRFGVPRWQLTGAVGPSASPFDLVGAGGAVRAAGHLAKATVAEAMEIGTVLRARIIGKKAPAEYSDRIRKAADAVEEFSGGKPKSEDIKINDAGDLVAMKDNKKFRRDVKRPGLKNDGTPDDPHFHLQEFRNGKWRNATERPALFYKRRDKMKWVSTYQHPENWRFEIIQDSQVGYYLWVYGGAETIDDLQDTFDMAKEAALEDFGVPLDSWAEVQT